MTDSELIAWAGGLTKNDIRNEHHLNMVKRIAERLKVRNKKLRSQQKELAKLISNKD
jgi:hypothetical protein